jgi:predicted transglutaminase-like protease
MRVTLFLVYPKDLSAFVETEGREEWNEEMSIYSLESVECSTNQAFNWTDSVITRLNSFQVVLTPWSRVFFEKLIVAQLVRTVFTFHGARRFITVFTGSRHRSLSGAR